MRGRTSAAQRLVVAGSARAVWVALLTLLAVFSVTRATASCLPPDAGPAMRATGPTPLFASIAIRPAPIKVGVPFNVDLHICSEANTPIDRLSIDAAMPAHRHGMNYKPELAAVGANKHEARGFLFHMPGHWEFTLTAYSGDKATHFKYGIEVK